MGKKKTLNGLTEEQMLKRQPAKDDRGNKVSLKKKPRKTK